MHAQPDSRSVPTAPAAATSQVEEMVVIENRIADFLKNHPRQVSILDREDIRTRNFLQVSEALNSLPGVDVQPSGNGMGYRISIRGSGNSGHIAVLINGRPAGTSQYGSADIDSIPIALVKRIEVFKPPVPVWLGPGSSAGAINIVIENQKPDTEKKAQNSGRVQARIGSFGTASTQISHVCSRPGRQLGLTAGAKHRDGKRTNSDRDSGSVGLHWNRALDAVTKLDVNGRYYQSRHGSPGRTDNPTPDARQTYKKGAIDVRLRGMGGDAWDYNLKAYGDAVRLEDRSQSGQTAFLDTRLLGLKGDTTWAQDNDKIALRLGGSLDRESADHTLTGLHRRDKSALHGQIDQQWRGFTFSAGGRWDYTSDFGSFPAGNAGISHRVGTDSVAKLNAGYSVNIPNFGQLYQPSHGAIDIVRGNPNLQEERVWNFSLGWQHQKGADRLLGLTVFRGKHE